MGSRHVSARIARQGRTRRDVLLPLSDAVTAAFQTYADRGVFRGFRATPSGRGRVEYRFLWMLRRPLGATFDIRRGVLTFPSLFPGLTSSSAMAVALSDVVIARHGRTEPAHRRVDGRRARVSSDVRRGDWRLVVQIRGANHEYAVRKSLNLVNELFVLLQASFPDYLIATFGLSPE